jgi:hypothetical protein
VKKAGHPFKLTEEEVEQAIVAINHQYEIKEPFTREEFIKYIADAFGRRATTGFVESFIVRHQDRLCTTIAHPLESGRADVYRSAGQEYRNRLAEALTGVFAMLVFNLDESGINDYVDSKDKVVLIPSAKQSLPTYYKQAKRAKTITVMPCICLDGTHLSPLLLTTRKTLDDDVYGPQLRKDLDVVIRSTAKGYTTAATFSEWVTSVFLPSLHFRRQLLGNATAPAVLLCDQASAHMTAETTSLLKENFVRLLHFPPHSSHAFQPCDLTTFAVLKRLLRLYHTDSELGKQAATVRKIVHALQQATSAMDVLTAFLRAGIVADTSSLPHLAKIDNDHFEKQLLLLTPDPVPGGPLNTVSYSVSITTTSTINIPPE